MPINELYLKRQREHTKQRAVERYHRPFNRSDYRILTAKIREGDAVFLEMCKDAAALWAVKYERRWFVTCFDLKTQQVSSLYPRFYLVKYRDIIFGTKT